AAPAAMDLHIDTVGLAGGAEVTEGDVKHWLWQFDNSSPVPVPTDAVSEADFAPHLNISTFISYAGVAAAYRARAAGKAAVSHDIAALATSLTRNTTDRREQARLLYEWVATHIAYIAIELGAGGFTPHSAADVLENRFGDCKDHVVLLEALLAAKGIESSPALIKAGENSYRLADAASPHAFDHVITYVPEFDLFADASDGDAPFGILPYADMGKPVLLASTGQVLRTPVPAGDSEVQIDSMVVVDAAGNATGHSAISAAGAYGITLRHLVRVMDHDKQTAWMHLLVGPEAEGKITGGVLSELQDPYTVTADYRLAQALQFPGPADLPVSLSLRPISFADLAGRGQPSRRGNDYVCPSLRATEKLTLVLPEGSSFSLLPTRATVDVPGIRLRVEYSQPNTSTMVRETALVIDHPAASCTPAYYAQVQEEQQDMVDILGQKIRYRGAAAGAVSP
ncbi:MAG: transglutaminase-like domain-containing protein, partial [Rhizomicrobium sp.]